MMEVEVEVVEVEVMEVEVVEVIEVIEIEVDKILLLIGITIQIMYNVLQT